jgi:predicted site-specific integrase-resolvase
MTSIQDAPSRGMKSRDAARYLGVSVNTLKKLIRLGVVPPPVRLPGLDRNIHDKVALDAVMTASMQNRNEVMP